MAELTPSLDMDISEDLTKGRGIPAKTSPSKIEDVLGLESVQILIPENAENVQTTSNSETSAKEKEQHSSRAVDNVPNTAEDKRRVEMRRRIGVVEANDTVQARRRNARVLSKKFGEAMLHEKPSIFNKKL